MSSELAMTSTTPSPTPAPTVAGLDALLAAAVGRLDRYREAGPAAWVRSQEHAIDRLLDRRLVLMGERDKETP